MVCISCTYVFYPQKPMCKQAVVPSLLNLHVLSPLEDINFHMRGIKLYLMMLS